MVSSLGCTELIFIDPGVKINGTYYLDVLLGEHLLPAIKELLGSEFFIFQKDSAPAHRARETVDLLLRETLDFISPTLWPPPIALISIRSITKFGESFKNVFIKPAYVTLTISSSDLWRNCFDQGIVDRAINEWRDRLRACIQTNGRHFEHQL